MEKKKSLFRRTTVSTATYPTTGSFDALRRSALGWIGAALLGAAGIVDCRPNDISGTAPLMDAQVDLRVDARPDGLSDMRSPGPDQEGDQLKPDHQGSR